VAGILIERSQEINALTSLWKAERAAVDHAIGPSIAETFELSDDDVESLSARQLQHEGDVFEEKPRHSPLAQKPKNLTDES
jgi:hypothetical protein